MVAKIEEESIATPRSLEELKEARSWYEETRKHVAGDGVVALSSEFRDQKV